MSEAALLSREPPLGSADRDRTTDANPKTRASALKVQAKRLPFAEGEKLLAPLQLKPDPNGKKPDQPGGDERLHALEAQVESEKKARLAQAEIRIVAAITSSRSWLEQADNDLGRLEGAIEGTLADDVTRDRAKAGVDDSIAAYTESQRLGLLDALTLILSFADALKSAADLLKRIPSKAGKLAVAPGFIAPSMDPDPVELFGEVRGEVAGVAGGVQDGAGVNMGGRDEVSKMAGALSGYVTSVQAGLGTLQSYVFGRDLSAIGHSFKSALNDHQEAVALAHGMGEGVSKSTSDEVQALSRGIAALTDSILTRIEELKRLVTARVPGAELAKGTQGRQLYDLIAQEPGAFELHVETELQVMVDRRGELAEREEHASYWLDVKNGRHLVTVDSILHVSSRLMRPSFAAENARQLDDDCGRPIATLLKPRKHPYEQVRITGSGGRHVIAARAEWEEPSIRERLLRQVDPREVGFSMP